MHIYHTTGSYGYYNAAIWATVVGYKKYRGWSPLHSTKKTCSKNCLVVWIPNSQLSQPCISKDFRYSSSDWNSRSSCSPAIHSAPLARHAHFPHFRARRGKLLTTCRIREAAKRGGLKQQHRLNPSFWQRNIKKRCSSKAIVSITMNNPFLVKLRIVDPKIAFFHLFHKCKPYLGEHPTLQLVYMAHIHTHIYIY